MSDLTAKRGLTILPIRKATLDALAQKFGPSLEDELRSAEITSRLDALTERQGRQLLKHLPGSLRNLLANEQRRTGEDSLRSETLPLDTGRNRIVEEGCKGGGDEGGLPRSVHVGGDFRTSVSGLSFRLTQPWFCV